MSKIELPAVTGNNNTSRINDNFKKIEDALNQEVLYRKGYVGEPNEMETNLDMNGKEILNVATGTSDGSLVTKSYVDQGLSLKFDKSGGPLSGPVDMNSNEILNVSRLSTDALEIGGVPVVPTDLAIYYYNETREALRRSYAEAGYTLVAGSFEAGGVLTSSSDVLLQESSDKAYSGAGPFPQVVAAGTDPASGGFVDRSSVFPREKSILDFGAKMNSPASATSNLLAFNAAILAVSNAGGGRVTVPTGVLYVAKVPGSSIDSENYIINKSNVTVVGAGKTATVIKRYSAMSIFTTDNITTGTNMGIRDLTLDGNAINFQYQANLLYMEQITGYRVENVLFKDCPGLHGLDINGCTNIDIIGCDFFGHDEGLSYIEDPGYRPEAIQIGHSLRSVPALRNTKNVNILNCRFGPSENLLAPIAAVGNHNVGTGFGAENVNIAFCTGDNLQQFFVRPFGWKSVNIAYCKAVATNSVIYISGRGNAYDESGANVRNNYSMCDGVNIHGCHLVSLNHHVINAALATSESDTYDQHKNINVTESVLEALSSTGNAIQLSWCKNVSIRDVVATGGNRGIYFYGVTDSLVDKLNSKSANTTNIEVVDVNEPQWPTVTAISKGLTIKNCVLSDAKYYSINVANTTDVVIEGNRFIDASKLANTRGYVILSGVSNRVIIKNNNGRQVAAATPAYGIQIGVACIDVTVGAENIFTATTSVVNNGVGTSYVEGVVLTKPSAPTTGNYPNGSRCLNSNPSIGQPKGWIKTASGWVSDGNL